MQRPCGRKEYQTCHSLEEVGVARAEGERGGQRKVKEREKGKRERKCRRDKGETNIKRHKHHLHGEYLTS